MCLQYTNTTVIFANPTHKSYENKTIGQKHLESHGTDSGWQPVLYA